LRKVSLEMEKIFENVKLLAEAVIGLSVKNDISPKKLSFYVN